VSGRFIINPHLRLAGYADRFFSYDARVTASPLVEMRTESMRRDEHDLLFRLKTHGFFLEPKSREELDACFVEEGWRAEAIDDFIRRGFLKPYLSPAESMENRVLEYFNNRYRPVCGRPETQAPFEEVDGNLHIFNPRTFFHLPREIPAEASHVGLLGLPLASLDASAGTEAGPGQLRLHSRSHCWFDVHRSGVYSEMVTEGGRPQVLCQDVVLRDAGDLDARDLTIDELMDRVRGVLAEEFFEPGVFPLIVGGDHAITYPIVRAFLPEARNLGLLHLDAHNDLFYTPQVVYSHAATISNLLRRTSIERIASFGLRTFVDRRMDAMRSVYENREWQGRISLFPLTALKQLIMNPGALASELEGLAGRPYYLTLDLDVLSESAIGGQLSTPFGSGLEWHELYYFLCAAFDTLNIVGCDIVEYNSSQGECRGQHRFLLNSLLMLLIDRLAKANPKFRKASDAAAAAASAAPLVS
jgi:arginase family enzyme